MRQWLASRTPSSTPRAACLQGLGIVCAGAVALSAFGLVSTRIVKVAGTASNTAGSRPSSGGSSGYGY